MDLTGISRSSCYRIIQDVCKAIVTSKHKLLDNIHFPQTEEECKKAAAEFENVSTCGVIRNCVSAIDGYLLKIITPSVKDVGNVRSFFSGHYQCHGFNVQAACDVHCRFQYFSVAGPGNLNDCDAVNEVSLGELVENLPVGSVAIADAAYTPTENMCALFYGRLAREEAYDNFNFFASQCRIRIEMAFGLMTMKWGILGLPLPMKLHNAKRHVIAIPRLHNYVINKRLRNGKNAFNSVQEARSAPRVSTPSTVHDQNGRPILTQQLQKTRGYSTTRQFMVDRVKEFGLKRPVPMNS